MLLAYVHFLNTNNIGDLMSAPYLYFKLSEKPDGKLFDMHANLGNTEFDAAIFGGGAVAGLMLNAGVHEKINAAKRIAWGIGRTVWTVTYHKTTPHEYPSGLDLLGIRDWFSSMPDGADWVPCASCMHPLFDRPHKVTRDAVGYFNYRRPIPRPPGISEAMTNANLLEKIIPFLGSAGTVVTNSYHGAYWATLLGRKVVIVDAYSSKFFDLKWPHVVAQASNWKSAESVSYSDTLAEARGANESFYVKVKELLGNG